MVNHEIQFAIAAHHKGAGARTTGIFVICEFLARQNKWPTTSKKNLTKIDVTRQEL